MVLGSAQASRLATVLGSAPPRSRVAKVGATALYQCAMLGQAHRGYPNNAHTSTALCPFIATNIHVCIMVRIYVHTLCNVFRYVRGAWVRDNRK